MEGDRIHPRAALAMMYWCFVERLNSLDEGVPPSPEEYLTRSKVKTTVNRKPSLDRVVESRPEFLAVTEFLFVEIWILPTSISANI